MGLWRCQTRNVADSAASFIDALRPRSRFQPVGEGAGVRFAVRLVGPGCAHGLGAPNRESVSDVHPVRPVRALADAVLGLLLPCSRTTGPALSDRVFELVANAGG
jgi:hypothetical protein